MDDMLAKVRANAARLGIEVIDVRVKRIEFSDDVSESVFRRMREERSRVAAELRAEGAENAEQLRAEADRERTVILAEAYRDAEKTRGQGDAAAASIYADAYTQDPEFYSFYRSIQAYRNSIGTESDVLVLGPDSDFLRYLKNSQGD
jgi:membrane protease subunit HflC